MEFQSDELSKYLNIETWDLIPVSDKAVRALEKGEDEDPMTGMSMDEVRMALESPDYLPVPDSFEISEYSMMESFAYSLSDESASQQLAQAIRGTGAFRRFKDTIHRLDLAEQWYAHRQRSYEKVAISWCEEHDLEYER
jgi:hypothetical protein